MNLTIIKKNRHLLFILFCILILVATGAFYFHYQKQKEIYKDIILTFKETAESYEVDTALQAISFIEDTNADEVIFPNIDTSKIGEHTFVYIAIKDGVQKEYVLSLTFVDPILPIITLTTNTDTKYVGEHIDLLSYIKESYDPVDGKLEVKIESPKDYEKVGTHEIKYIVEDKNGNIQEAKLTLVIKEKIKEEQNTEKSKNSQQKQKKDATTNTQEVPSNNQNNISHAYYYFADGYNMETAMSTCSSALSGKSGECRPMKDQNGIYIGVELILY